MRNKAIFLAIAIPLCMLLAAFVYYLPPVHDRLAWRIDALQARIQYAINPPEEVVFIPGTQPTDSGIIPATATVTPSPSATATQPGPPPPPPPSPPPPHPPTRHPARPHPDSRPIPDPYHLTHPHTRQRQSGWHYPRVPEVE